MLGAKIERLRLKERERKERREGGSERETLGEKEEKKKRREGGKEKSREKTFLLFLLLAQSAPLPPHPSPLTPLPSPLTPHPSPCSTLSFLPFSLLASCCCSPPPCDPTPSSAKFVAVEVFLRGLRDLRAAAMSIDCCLRTEDFRVFPEGGRERGREGGREGRREGWREGEREGWRERRREGGREKWKERGIEAAKRAREVEGSKIATCINHRAHRLITYTG